MSESEPPTPGPNMPEPRDAERGEPADLDSEHGEPAGFDAERNEPAGFDAERRRTLQTLAVVLNALAAALVAIPVLGYLLAPLVRRRRDAWIDLGGVEVFPMNQTRLTTYRNPHTIPWDGQSENVACYVHRSSAEKFSIFAVNCTHLGCPVDWFPESGGWGKFSWSPPFEESGVGSAMRQCERRVGNISANSDRDGDVK